MTIGVNYRLGLNPASGIPLTIRYLYSELAKEKSLAITKFIPPKFAPSLLFDYFYCAYLLLVHPVDVFHAPSFVLPICKPKNTKFLVTIHDLAFMARPEVATWRFRVAYGFLVRHSLRIADCVIAVSENTKKDIIKYFSISPQKIVVIPNGISPAFLANKPQPDPFGFGYLLTVSTHPYRKNTFMLVDAFSQLNPSFKLVIAGNLGEYGKQALLRQISQLGLQDRVIITGKVSEAELSALYQHAQLFIYPSTYEGFGMPLLEAMASNCLVLGANTSCLPEVVPDKRCLFYPIDSSTIAAKIRQLISLPDSQKLVLKNKFRLFALNYAWKNSAKGFLSLL